jgi:cysteinyl-tRNA synthetase
MMELRMNMRIYNTLTRKLEEFIPLNPPKVGMYACGPTVYDYAHIGNFRTYVLADVLRRALEYLDFRVTLVSNITDVGHLVSDADEGEDKLEKGARREGKTAWDIAKKYADVYFDHEKKLNVLPPDVRCKATDYVKQQIELVKKLEARGFTYKTGDGIYFDTGKFSDYGKLAPQHLDDQKAGTRVEVNPDKKQPADFALWKFSPPPADGKKRDMEWDSPWGTGFPGWHIECSAMAMAHLGEQFDIHVGGSDLKQIHHNNEIAQSEAASGKSPFVKYWIHGEFLMVDGEKMSKSKNNFYNLENITEKGFEPLALRYLYLSTHYRSFLNFTWESLKAAQEGLNNLRQLCQGLTFAKQRLDLKTEKLEKIQHYSDSFRQAVENDLAMPEALAVAWEAVKSNIPAVDKRDLISEFDQVLGLDLSRGSKGPTLPRQGLALSDPQVPENIRRPAEERETARKNRDWKTADELRKKIESLGYRIEDSPAGPELLKIIKSGRMEL